MAGGCGPSQPTGQTIATPQTDTEQQQSDYALADPVTVLRVIDGDTIEIDLDGTATSVRLKGINSPELQPEPEGAEPEPYAEAAKQFVLIRIGGQVDLEFEAACGSDPLTQCRDAYDRLLAYIRLGNGIDLGRQLLSQGLAQVYRVPNGQIPDFERMTDYLSVEATAQAANRGIWSP